MWSSKRVAWYLIDDNHSGFDLHYIRITRRNRIDIDEKHSWKSNYVKKRVGSHFNDSSNGATYSELKTNVTQGKRFKPAKRWDLNHKGLLIGVSCLLA